MIILELEMIGKNLNEFRVDKIECRDLENCVKQLSESVLSLSMRIRAERRYFISRAHDDNKIGLTENV